MRQFEESRGGGKSEQRVEDKASVGGWWSQLGRTSEEAGQHRIREGRFVGPSGRAEDAERICL